jgi:hypothetical protein
MAWLIVSPVGFDSSNSTPWYIKSSQSISIPPCKEMSIHGLMVVEGQVIINDQTRLRIEA